MEGWPSAEELIGWGFAHALVVMANEAHSGLARCIRTRDMGVHMIQAAHEAGVWRLAMEALPWPAKDTPGPILATPPGRDGYLAQPDMRRLISKPAAWASWRRRSVCLIWSPGYRDRMAETQREPVPRVDSGELDTALAFLSFARHCVLKKADGLSDEQLRRVLVDSGTSVLGLVQHLAEAERYWFGYHLVGAAWDADREYGMAVSANRAAADVLRDYRAAIEDSDRAIRAVGDPEARFVVPVDGNRHTLRWVMAHMTSETARHAGHADILREQLDGTTGR